MPRDASRFRLTIASPNATTAEKMMPITVSVERRLPRRRYMMRSPITSARPGIVNSGGSDRISPMATARTWLISSMPRLSLTARTAAPTARISRSTSAPKTAAIFQQCGISRFLIMETTHRHTTKARTYSHISLLVRSLRRNVLSFVIAPARPDASNDPALAWI